MSRLRRALEPGRPARAPAQVLVTEPPGYALRLDPDQVDAYRFERLVGEGRSKLADGDPQGALALLDEALSLWRGPALADFAFEPFATVAVSRLDELRAAAEEDRIDARLAAGDHVGASTALPPLIAAHPLRERLRGQLMVALYRSGRQAEALRAYEDARRLLVDELGIDPGRDLQLLYRQLLEQDPGLDAVVQPRPKPAPAAAPAAPPADRRPAGARARPDKPLVGRGGALEVLDRAWHGALDGHTRFVVIAGEPGIGKTTLAEELASRAEASGAAVAWGRCHDDEGALPLWPWAQVVRALTPAAETPEHRRPVLAALLPELGEPDAPLDADAARFRLYDAVRDSLERAGERRPVVVVLDDLHWADASSLRLLRFLMVEIKDVRLLVLVTLRDTEGDTGELLAVTLGDLARTQAAERIVLGGLTEPDVAELVRLTTGVPDEHAEALAPELFRRADGNPFFVTELVRLLDSERRVRPGEALTEIPAAVGDVVRQRVRRLPDDSQGLLRVAAAIGREFDLDVLGLAAGLDDDDLLDALEPAIVTRIVSQSGSGGYRFAHALVRDALYLDIPPTRRWRLHGAIGDAIESLHAANLGPASGELAHHFIRSAGAGRAEKAFRYACMAAEQAARRLSFDEAAAHWQEALDLVDRRAGGAPDPAEQSRLLLQLATALRHAGDLTASVAAQDEALAAAERSGDLDALARAALSYGRVGLWQRREYATVDPRVVAALERLLRLLPTADDPQRSRLLAGLAVALYYSEEHRDRVGALAAEALAMARRLGDRELVGHVFDQVHVMLGRDEQLRTLADLSTWASDGDGAVVADPAGQARLARLRLALGDASRLESDVDDALRAGEALCDPALRQFAGWLRTTVAFLRGRLDEVEPLAARARPPRPARLLGRGRAVRVQPDPRAAGAGTAGRDRPARAHAPSVELPVGHQGPGAVRPRAGRPGRGQGPAAAATATATATAPRTRSPVPATSSGRPRWRCWPSWPPPPASPAPRRSTSCSCRRPARSSPCRPTPASERSATTSGSWPPPWAEPATPAPTSKTPSP